tara:strand:+ start:7357 stop:7983 length:627 start_codon:yes stop_codon:yes gene_type:complete
LSSSWQERTLALAGLIQTVQQVSSIARTGLLARDSMEQSLASIFVQNPSTVSDVYAGARGVRTGLGALGDMLKGFNLQDHGDLLRYMFAVISLERALSADPVMLKTLGERIASIEEQRLFRQQYQSGIDDTTIVELAELYQATLGKIEPRIKVSGSRQQLQIPANINRIRALLLAAVRAAVLWRQVGGRRWQFLTSRGRLQEALNNIL